MKNLKNLKQMKFTSKISFKTRWIGWWSNR